MSTVTIHVPDLSGASDVDVVEIMVSPGDVIAEGDSLIAVETDKASMEVPSPQGGTVVEVLMSEGATCNEGDAIVTLSAEAAEPAAVEQEAPVVEAAAEHRAGGNCCPCCSTRSKRGDRSGRA